MPKLDPRQLATAFQASQSGKGCRLDDAEQLRDFAAYVRAQGEVVSNVETFEIRGDWEIPRIDLGIYQGGEKDYSRPSCERVALSEEALLDVLSAIEHEAISCVFQVWADELENPLAEGG
jgi:hypothetical protein